MVKLACGDVRRDLWTASECRAEGAVCEVSGGGRGGGVGLVILDGVIMRDIGYF